MNIVKNHFLLCLSLLLAFSSVGALNVHASEDVASAPVVSLKEMPLLRGNTWQEMTHDEKIAFIWGMGHVITMERERMERFPEIKSESFAVKIANGLAGMPMSDVVGVVDQYYKDNPDKTGEPVVKVIWTNIVKPKIKGNESNPPAEK